MNNRYSDKSGTYPIQAITLETMDRVLKSYFNDKLNITVETEQNNKKVNIIFATRRTLEINKGKLKG